MEDTDRSWLAAVLDCDGTIGFEKIKLNRIYPSLSIFNTNEELVKKASKLLGSNVTNQKHSYGHFGKKIIYFTRTRKKKNIVNILTQIISYLIIKKEKAELILAYYKEKEELTKLYGFHIRKKRPKIIDNFYVKYINYSRTPSNPPKPLVDR